MQKNQATADVMVSREKVYKCGIELPLAVASKNGRPQSNM
jgi:hypothetical protein